MKKNSSDIEVMVVPESNKSIEEFEETPNQQMELFYLLNKEDRDFSHLVDLYDLLPKFIGGKHKRTNGKYLPAVVKEFTYRGARYSLTVKPARLTKIENGTVQEEKEFFPGTREELIEDALRKIACDGAGMILADDQGEEAGVVFTLYGLQQELKKSGHTYSIVEIKEGLMVGAQTILDLRSNDGKDILLSPMFSTVGMTDRNDWKQKGKNSKAFVRFNPLVSRSIKQKTYRQFAYSISMKFRFSLARYLHKRMSFMFRQASRLESYTIGLKTLLEDSGTTLYAKLSNNHREAKKAFAELEKMNVISTFDEEIINGARGKIEDIKYTFYPHGDFIKDMRRFNAKGSQLTLEDNS
ncbi:MAG: hypothetical protein U9N86_02915 [Bacteroidota bacterium]|nr:hypothetical protein [Bacteroidota bacterium]